MKKVHEGNKRTSPNKKLVLTQLCIKSTNSILVRILRFFPKKEFVCYISLCICCWSMVVQNRIENQLTWRRWTFYLCFFLPQIDIWDLLFCSFVSIFRFLRLCVLTEAETATRTNEKELPFLQKKTVQWMAFQEEMPKTTKLNMPKSWNKTPRAATFWLAVLNFRFFICFLDIIVFDKSLVFWRPMTVKFGGITKSYFGYNSNLIFGFLCSMLLHRCCVQLFKFTIYRWVDPKHKLSLCLLLMFFIFIEIWIATILIIRVIYRFKRIITSHDIQRWNRIFLTGIDRHD